MAPRVLTDCKLWLDGFDLSGDMNALGLDYASETQDDTVFGDDTRSRLGGLKTFGFNHQGLWNGGDDEVDDVLFGDIGLVDVLMSAAPEIGAAGETAYFGRIGLAEYSPAGVIGEIFRFTVSGEASDTPVQGTIMLNGSALTASGNGTARQLGAVAAGEKLYAGIHVLAASGTSPTLDVTVESDDNSGMTSATTRITFSQFTAIGSEWATPVDGAITDDWWRIDYTIGGTSPSFDVIVLLGIQ